MFDLGWTEFIVIAVVAILVVGPKELPGMLRTIGKTIGNMRRMAGDFQRQMNDALKEADLDGIKTGIDSVKSINPVSQIKGSLNPIKQAAEDVQRDINKGLLKPGDGSKSVDTAEPVSTDADTSATEAKTVAKPRAAAKPKTAKPKTAAKPRTAAKPKTAAKATAAKPAAAKSSAKTGAAKSGAAKTTTTRKPATRKTAAKSADAAKKESDA